MTTKAKKQAPENTKDVVVLTTEQVISTELAKFPASRESIAKMKDQYKGMVIAGVEDESGYQSVKNARNIIKKARTSVEATRKEIKEPALRVCQAIDKEGAELTKLLLEIEKPLEDELAKIDAEKEKIAKAEEMKLDERQKNRVAELKANGVTMDEGYYVIGSTISIDVVTLRGMKDERYAEFLDRVKKEHAAILEAKEKEEREDRERREKLESDERAAKEERERLDRERMQLVSGRHDLRHETLINKLGLSFDERHARYYKERGHNFYSTYTQLWGEMSTEEWNNAFAQIEKDFAAWNENVNSIEQSEKERADKEEKLREETRIKAARTGERLLLLKTEFGISKMTDGGEYVERYFENSKQTYRVGMYNVTDSSVEDWDLYLVSVKQMIDNALVDDRMAEAENRKKAEQERKAALTDAQRITEWLRAVMAVEAPELTSEEVKQQFDAHYLQVVEHLAAINNVSEQFK